MVDQIIRPAALPNRANPNSSEKVPVDNGSTVGGSTIEALVLAGRPTATQIEAQEGTDSVRAMTPLTTRQAISFQAPSIVNPIIDALNLGSLSTKNNINNGDWLGSDLSIENGGTGSSTAASARSALGTPSQEEAVPPGGATGQVLAKSSNNDFATTWVEPSGIEDGNKGGVIVAGDSWTLAPNSVTNETVSDSAAISATKIFFDSSAVGVDVDTVQEGLEIALMPKFASLADLKYDTEIFFSSVVAGAEVNVELFTFTTSKPNQMVFISIAIPFTINADIVPATNVAIRTYIDGTAIVGGQWNGELLFNGGAWQVGKIVRDTVGPVTQQNIPANGRCSGSMILVVPSAGAHVVRIQGATNTTDTVGALRSRRRYQVWAIG